MPFSEDRMSDIQQPADSTAIPGSALEDKAVKAKVRGARILG
jgi:hypothetical protein